MRISIQRIPATEEVLKCLATKEQRDFLKKKRVISASVLKHVDEADEEFIRALKIILALPDTKKQPPLIGFT